ncbi:Pentatricopeptide repeat-containing protein At4g39952, mitochondrial [Linum perenne]
MYAKCGVMECASRIFDKISERDVVSWTALITGYVHNGESKKACAHSGLVDEGKHLFNKMKGYSVMPTLKHYACIVDLLGRSGNLLEAEKLVLSMPVLPDGGVWGALLSACKMHDDIETGIRIAKQAIKADPKNDGYYIVMSDMYSSIGRWKEAEQAREMMKERGIEKRAGWSLV